MARVLLLIALTTVASVSGLCPDEPMKNTTCKFRPWLQDTLMYGINFPHLNSNSTLKGLRAWLQQLGLDKDAANNRLATIKTRKYIKKTFDAYEVRKRAFAESRDACPYLLMSVC